jgi:hypothetical protein
MTTTCPCSSKRWAPALEYDQLRQDRFKGKLSLQQLMIAQRADLTRRVKFFMDDIV